MKNVFSWRLALALLFLLSATKLVNAQGCTTPVTQFNIEVYNVNMSTLQVGSQLTSSSELTPGSYYVVYITGIGASYTSTYSNPVNIQLRNGDGYIPGYETGSTWEGYTFNPWPFPVAKDTGPNASDGYGTVKFYIKTPDLEEDMVRPIYFGVRARCSDYNQGGIGPYGASSAYVLP
jgi:hypothetical protein